MEKMLRVLRSLKLSALAQNGVRCAQGVAYVTHVPIVAVRNARLTIQARPFVLVRARLSQLLVAAATCAGAMTKRSDVESMAHLLRFDVRLPLRYSTVQVP